MNKKEFRVEFHPSGRYDVHDSEWSILGEFLSIEADTAQEAIEYAIDFMVDSDWLSFGDDDERVEYESYAWRAYEVIDGTYDPNSWECKK